uniref:Liprin-beta-1/2 coiled-coil domain-containing protein n=1 Tax=Gopherus evgoodei TaxID=1825980 RepID=A0A8C4VL98_9SAUR
MAGFCFKRVREDLLAVYIAMIFFSIKAATEYANSIYDIVSPAPSVYLGTFRILHLLEDLKMALEMLDDPQEREALRNQIPGDTARLYHYLQSQVNHLSSANNETYQERLARLEGDKESLILQVSVLTDQVEAQGEKIRDLEVCLEGHQLKLNATEEMLQQELLSRTSLETQKLDLMAEVSDLKIKLVGMEKEQSEYEEKQNKAEDIENPAGNPLSRHITEHSSPELPCTSAGVGISAPNRMELCSSLPGEDYKDYILGLRFALYCSRKMFCSKFT